MESNNKDETFTISARMKKILLTSLYSIHGGNLVVLMGFFLCKLKTEN